MSRTYFTPDHEWLTVEDGIATIGITDHAQQQLGDLVFVGLPSVGAAIAMGEPVVVVESVKAASDVYAPADGEVIAVNDAVAGEAALVNASPAGEGWLWKMRLADESQLEGLLDEAGYRATL